MYNNIVNPKTNRLVKTNSKLGRLIVKKYYNMLTSAVGGRPRRRRYRGRPDNEVKRRFREWYGDDDDYDSDRPSVEAHFNFQGLRLARHRFTMDELEPDEMYNYECISPRDDTVEEGTMLILNVEIDDSDHDHFVINCNGFMEITYRDEDGNETNFEELHDVRLFSISYDRDDNQWYVTHDREIISKFIISGEGRFYQI